MKKKTIDAFNNTSIKVPFIIPEITKNDKTKCKELVMNGYEHIHKTCNSQEMVQHMLRIYEKTG